MAKSGTFAKSLVYVLILGAAGAGGWFYFKKQNVKPPEVLSTTVNRGEVIQSVTATGDLQAVTSVDVSSQVSGLMVEVLVDFNDEVKVGQVLARLDPATYVARLNQAKADLASTTASNTLTRLNTERIRELRTKNLVSQQELDQAEAQLAQSDASLLTRRSAVSDAEVNLARCTILSPIDGIVLDRQTEVGKTVSASLNAPTLFTIVNDLAKMQINAAVAEADIGSIADGQNVNFTVDAFPNRQFRGRVSQIRNLPQSAQSVVVYSTIIDVDNRDLMLKPGMTANVSIIIAQRENALVISNAALRARIPDEFRPAAPSRPGAPAGAAGAGGDAREQMSKLMAEAGFTPGSGPPSAEVMAKVRSLAEERGIQLPERTMGGGRGGNGSGGTRGTRGAATTNAGTVYRLVESTPLPKVEAVPVRLGITNGSITEVVEGLNEGDVLVTSITIPGAPVSSSSSQMNNPFQQQRGGMTGRR
jgi:HlyD family secretion protein